MFIDESLRAVRVLLTAGALIGLAGPAEAQTLLERSAEARFQLDLHVPDQALMDYIPEGWTLNVAAQGPAKDANLRAIFVDRMTINGPDGGRVGSGSHVVVYLAAPVTTPAGENVQLVIGGLTDDASQVPGPFGVYRLASTRTMQRSSTAATGDGPILDSQDWLLSADSGEYLEMHIRYERGVAARREPREVKFYSSKDPNSFQISTQEQVLDILRNVTTEPRDRVREFSFRAGGGSYAKLFDGTERLLSWDNIVWLNRSVFLP